VRLLGARLSAQSRRTVLEAVGAREEDVMEDGEERPVDPRVVAGLLIGSPEFQKQ
jgi:hypothetical protein